MSGAIKKNSTTALLVLVAVLLTAFVAGRGPTVIAGTPANKAAAVGTTTQVAAPAQDVTLMTKTIRTSSPQDLLFEVTAECSIVTNVTTTGTDDQRAFGHIEMWVTFDGRPVLVGPDDSQAGRVVFCDRAYERQTTFNQDDQDDAIATFFSTRSTHAFNWILLNAGSGLHQVQLHALLTATATNTATAEAVLGNRTIIISPAHFAQNADLVSN
ncbi:MAG: hypothetical protein ABR552_04545 [Actinomycetota bacterium]